MVCNNDAYVDACLHAGGDYAIDIASDSAANWLIKLLQVMMLLCMCFMIILCFFRI